ncbi:hypothetical protein [Paracoccus aerodenitrificans]|uniref:hypothetical protein n=1 Tax=Paracoccus aerodenitrificans TaxID=3017781 RepID=UPI0022EFE0FB|nr:hypothetical protein [Paracoccus aerodenitrificans]WBU62842.1 hypothetical protein PAE61_10705 [Paracoccus aerodenitrificans]
MTDTRNISAGLIAALAAVLVIAGLILSGGPGQARQEYRDRIRVQNLTQLSENILCLAQDEGALPDAPSVTVNCPGPLTPRDPFTDAPYRYEITGDRNFRLCATFERPDIVARQHAFGVPDFDSEAGCLPMRLHDEVTLGRDMLDAPARTR